MTSLRATGALLVLAMLLLATPALAMATPAAPETPLPELPEPVSEAVEELSPVALPEDAPIQPTNPVDEVTDTLSQLQELQTELTSSAEPLTPEETPNQQAAPETESSSAPASVSSTPASWWDTSEPAVVASAMAAVGIAVMVAKQGLWSRAIAPIAATLFSRLQGPKVLEHPKRASLHQLVCRNPGITVPDLAQATGLSRNATLHHLRKMETEHHIVSSKQGRSMHWFENGGRYGRDRKEAYSILQDERTRHVANGIAAKPGMTQVQLANELGLAPSVLHWHVQRLEQAALVERRRNGRTVQCFPVSALPNLRV